MLSSRAIEVQGEYGHGSTFTFKLPVIHKEEANHE